MVPVASSLESVAITRSICRQWQKRVTLPSSRLRSARSAASKPASSPKRAMRSDASASAARPWMKGLSMRTALLGSSFPTADKCRQHYVDHVTGSAGGWLMSDVFVSYKAEDRRRVKPLVEALEADGYSVWWDEQIGGGTAWRHSIEAELNAAKCVIVA